jgi:hypothetical protein
MNKFDTLYNILNEQLLIEDVSATLGDQHLARELFRFNTKMLPACSQQGTPEECAMKFNSFADQLLGQIKSKVKSPAVLQIINQYQGASSVSVLKALYLRLFNR